MGFEDMTRWVDDFDLIANRVGVMNQLLGCRYHEAACNPFVLRMSGSVIQMFAFGEMILEFGTNDDITEIVGTVDAISEIVWLMKRSGYISNKKTMRNVS